MKVACTLQLVLLSYGKPPTPLTSILSSHGPPGIPPSPTMSTEAYISGKSWYEALSETGSRNTFYHNVISTDEVKTEPSYAASITPVIHYCMGGLEIDCDSAVYGPHESVIPGLYAAGEVAGSMHGNNRLGGNSLV